jgi:hypothetical protein
VRRLALALGTSALLAAAPAWADGGLVRLSQAAGPYTITVFSAPTPLRAGPIDLSVLVQRRDGGAPVLDAAVAVALHSGAARLEQPATRAAATNKLLYAAPLLLPSAGRWEVAVTVGDEIVRFAMDAEPAASTVLAFWGYLVLPFLLIGLFALHQRLILRPRAEKEEN